MISLINYLDYTEKPIVNGLVLDINVELNNGDIEFLTFNVTVDINEMFDSVTIKFVDNARGFEFEKLFNYSREYVNLTQEQIDRQTYDTIIPLLQERYLVEEEEVIIPDGDNTAPPLLGPAPPPIEPIDPGQPTEPLPLPEPPQDNGDIDGDNSGGFDDMIDFDNHG